jgi:hypothetical protein
MVMFDEVRDYQKMKDQMSSQEKSELSAAIVDGFRARGMIPGAYRPLWRIYERRLKACSRRAAPKDGGNPAINKGSLM